MKRVIVQVPMSLELKKRAEEASSDLGFTSVQEVIRVFLRSLSRKEVAVSVGYPEEKLSAKAIKRYNSIAKEIEEGKGIHQPKNDEEFFDMLNS
jgi:antitoxin component of RelBE/YafQ-DinJ toxin-antitoxin module